MVLTDTSDPSRARHRPGLHRALAAAIATLEDPTCAPERRAAAASGGKARASQAALAICNEALQMHGAIGYTDEYDLGLYLNRALVLSAWLGNAAAERIEFPPLKPNGLTMRWTNRPTFQQIISFSKHR